MSQPKRYSIRGFSAALVEEENGVMVKWEDYAALKAETVKQIEAALPPVEAYIAKLEAENAELKNQIEFYKCKLNADPKYDVLLWKKFLDDLDKFSADSKDTTPNKP